MSSDGRTSELIFRPARFGWYSAAAFKVSGWIPACSDNFLLVSNTAITHCCVHVVSPFIGVSIFTKPMTTNLLICVHARSSAVVLLMRYADLAAAWEHMRCLFKRYQPTVARQEFTKPIRHFFAQPSIYVKCTLKKHLQYSTPLLSSRQLPSWPKVGQNLWFGSSSKKGHPKKIPVKKAVDMWYA